jgi:hypothetical protein
MKHPSLRLKLERLEDRCTPATWGNPWPDAAHLTLSFVPDGTPIGNSTSSLYSLLNRTMPMAAWQGTILRAFQTWAANASINVGVVADNGAPYGVPGVIQGDSRFGDIRIFACDLGPDVIAVSTPFDPSAGTAAGDVEFNSRYLFGSAGQNAYDLFTVAAHEAGHVFGLADNNDPTSMMDGQWTQARTGLSAADFSNLLQLYSPRTPAGNSSRGSATSLPLGLQSDGSLEASTDGSLAGNNDVNWYAFTTPVQLLNMTVTLETSGLSTLLSRVTVYNAWGQVVAAATATNPLQGDLTLNSGGLGLFATYYVEVQSASSDVFGVGSYHLTVQSLPGAVSGLSSLLVGSLNNVTSSLAQSLPTNTSFATASLLPPTQQVGSRFDYAFRSNISALAQGRYYEFAAPTPAAGQASVLTVMAWGLGSQGLLPTVTVYDAAAQPVPGQILVNDSGMIEVQVVNPVAGANYYVKVASAKAQGSGSTGNFFLGINFSTQPVVLQQWVQGTVDQNHLEVAQTLQVYQTQLFHFVVAANAADPTAQAGVRMTIFDASGNVVFTLVATNGQTQSGNVFLNQGTYVVHFDGGTPNGASLPTVTFTLWGITLTQPIGPTGSDPTNSPSQSPPPQPPPDSSNSSQPSLGPSSTSGASTDPSWSNGSGTTTTSSGQGSDPYSNPYS